MHQIPCGHAYCRSCLAELRAKDVPQTCPLCRAELPPGLDGLYDLGFRTLKRMHGMVKRGEISWASLPAAEQEEMDEAVAMLTEASSQGHMLAQAHLGDIYGFGWGVAQEHGRAFKLTSMSARQGQVESQYQPRVHVPGWPGVRVIPRACD